MVFLHVIVLVSVKQLEEERDYTNSRTNARVAEVGHKEPTQYEIRFSNI